MKIKVIFGLVLLALSASAYAYQSHSWQKVSESRDQNGKTICQYTPWEEQQTLDEFLRRDAAAIVIDDATYLREAMYDNQITFTHALMALRVSELRGLNHMETVNK